MLLSLLMSFSQYYLGLLLLLLSCGTPRTPLPRGSNPVQSPVISARDSDDYFMLIERSTDPAYGYTEAQPVQVGGAAEEQGPYHERKYLNGLRGPNGEDITYTRVMSCCHFKTPNGFDGVGLLDVYELSWEGAEKPLRLYLNMYDESEVLVPVGLRSRVE